MMIMLEDARCAVGGRREGWEEADRTPLCPALRRTLRVGEGSRKEPLYFHREGQALQPQVYLRGKSKGESWAPMPRPVSLWTGCCVSTSCALGGPGGDPKTHGLKGPGILGKGQPLCLYHGIPCIFLLSPSSWISQSRGTTSSHPPSKDQRRWGRSSVGVPDFGHRQGAPMGV